MGLVLKPTTTELLGGVRRGLTEDVLPKVSDGGAARQLRAALHILGRLERSWDRMPAYLAADNDDIAATLSIALADVAAAAAGADYSDLFTRLAKATGGNGTDTQQYRVHDHRLAMEMAVNEALQGLLEDFDHRWRSDQSLDGVLREQLDRRILELYLRMVEREAQAAGTDDDH
ncbi:MULTISPECIES: hypothetical protein [unclassified Rhodococcus (in: high G+C Gram-positive bacteria)]|uniref:hypothetical protein n=1 Tax=unclassified Rhodococcus (in: high G+C Gram-positive bacteria) TaxID=192944 RepID=UPI00163B4C16|nr:MULTISPECIES: hypothetical protein [unclassified Rhodococcus (in: high G+C Gram-positive bacteria)]MBC2644519.1 hypothetical protein [Rhodococcus sp. 3A]MBC2897792.1 hypothetical protein [Rhodococcus sp. 4CII]